MKKKIFSALALVLAFALVFTSMGKTTQASAYAGYGHWWWGYYNNNHHFDEQSKKTTFTVYFYSASGRRLVDTKTFEGKWDKDCAELDTREKGAYIAEIELPNTYDGIRPGYEVVGWNFGNTWKGDTEYALVKNSPIHGYANYERPEFTCVAILGKTTDEQAVVTYTVKFEGMENASVEGKQEGEEVELPEYTGTIPEGQEFDKWLLGSDGKYTVNKADADEDNVITIKPEFKVAESSGEVTNNENIYTFKFYLDGEPVRETSSTMGADGFVKFTFESYTDENTGRVVEIWSKRAGYGEGEGQYTASDIVWSFKETEFSENKEMAFDAWFENSGNLIDPAEDIDNNNNDNNDYIPVVLATVVVEEEKVVEDIKEVETPEAPAEEEEKVEEIAPETVEIPEVVETPEALPKTGVAPASLFFGIGAACIALGGVLIALRRKNF